MAKNDSDELEGREMAEVLLTSGLSQARAIKALEGKGIPAKIEVSDLHEALDRHVQQMQANGGTQAQEEMLWNQARTLEQLFVRLIERAANQTHVDNYDRLLRLALRAQNQSRSTLQALEALQSPKSHVFARQANVAQNQQINHTTSPNESAPEKIQNEQNELLEDDTHGQRLDTRTTGSTGTGDPAVEAVGAIDRPKDT
ncbi:hypothetical protein [Thioalkalivibrio sp. ALJ15]|uniref:hypothetical protein n=1 Tax=Thioalkalivibrio sp. ALJ15 TaxID=748652 RepID=UPI000367B994|nr:hypothetical protein [Thioalkalivibrio sp. ALJ15]